MTENTKQTTAKVAPSLFARYQWQVVVGVVVVVCLATAFILLKVYYKPYDSSDNIIGISGLTADAGPAGVGKTAPAFALPDLAGNLVNLSQYRGQVVYMTFAYTWCFYCNQELPELQRFYNEAVVDDEQLFMFSIYLDEDVQVTKDYVTEKGISFPILTDENHYVGDQYSVFGTPTHVVVDANGTVCAKDFSQTTFAKVSRQITKCKAG